VTFRQIIPCSGPPVAASSSTRRVTSGSSIRGGAWPGLVRASITIAPRQPQCFSSTNASTIGRINVSNGFYDVPFVRSNGRQTVTLDGGFLSDNIIEFWDFRSGRKTLRLEHKESPVLPVVFSPKGERLAFINHRTPFIFNKGVHEIVVFDFMSRSVTARLREPKCVATAFSFTKDGRQIISGSSDGGIRIWKLPSSR